MPGTPTQMRVWTLAGRRAHSAQLRAAETPVLLASPLSAAAGLLLELLSPATAKVEGTQVSSALNLGGIPFAGLGAGLDRPPREGIQRHAGVRRQLAHLRIDLPDIVQLAERAIVKVRVALGLAVQGISAAVGGD